MPLNLDAWKAAYGEWEEIFRDLHDTSEVRVAALVSINLADLETTLLQHPSLYAYASVLFEKAQIDETRAKYAYEEKRAAAWTNMQREDPDLAIGRIDKQVDAVEEVKKAREFWLGKSARLGVIRSLTKALEHRRDMLVQLSAKKRQEINNL